MAASAFDAFEKGMLALMSGDVDFAADDIKAALLDSDYAPDVVVDDVWSDISADECADGDYTQQALASKAVTVVSNKVRFDCADIDFGNAVTITAKYLVIYKDTGTPGTSKLLWVTDLNSGGGSASSTASDFDVAINASGIYEIMV